MKRLSLFLWAGLLAGCAAGRASISTHDEVALATHRSVAILPFEVTQNRIRLSDIRFSGTKSTPPTQQRIEQEWTAKQQYESRVVAYRLQELLESQLQAQPPTRGYTVAFQPVGETNRLLKQAGITYENLPDKTVSELQEALHVDAILSGQTMLYQPMPTGLGIAARLMLNEPLLTNQSVVPANQATSNLVLYDSRSGELVWRFDFERAGNNSLKPERLINDLVRAVAPGFPYARK